MITFAKTNEPAKNKKRTVFASWGYNRAFYTHSAIHFIGNEYDFTLKQSIAKDRQSPFAIDPYFKLSKLTIPQYNFAIGVSISKNWAISIGQDHMKYVVQQYSHAVLDGYIHSNSEFAGEYHNQPITITPHFLQYEHTDGLNYVHFEADKTHTWFQKKHVHIQTALGCHAGVLIPRSDVTLMNYKRNNTFHLAGYGLGIHAGVHASIFRYFFFQFDTKDGIINMPYVLTRGIDYKDRAKQHFVFFEFFTSLGIQYPF